MANNGQHYVGVIDLGTIAAGASSQKSYTNDSDQTFVIDQIEVALWLSAALAGAIVGTEIGTAPSPTAANNTHVSRALYDIEYDDGETRNQSGPIPLAALLNPDGKTYLQNPIRVAPGKRFTVKVTSRSSTAAVEGRVCLMGYRSPVA